MTEFSEVWRSSGPPALAVESASVAHNGRTWVQRRVQIGDGHAGVVIIPVADSQVCLVRLWRPTVGEIRLELPRGLGECDSPQADAERELLEETGLRADSMRSLGEFDLDTGIMPTRICVFEATIDLQQSPADRDGEIDEVVWMPRNEIQDAITDGRLRDAITLAAFACWSAAG